MSGIELNPGVIDQFSIKQPDDTWLHTYLSNGYIEPDGTFVEREYQAAKTLDREASGRILACEEPFGRFGSKKMGQALEAQGLMRPDWENVKFQVMSRLVMRKFMDHDILAELLVETGDALLVEGNTWHDNIWGNCTCGGSSQHPSCVYPGKNWLGQILMVTREFLDAGYRSLPR